MYNRTDKLESRLFKIDVPTDIIAEAASIHKELPESLQRIKENMKYYLCATEAYKKLGRIPDATISLETEFNIDTHKRKRLYKMCLRFDYQPRIVIYEPLDFIEKYMKIIGMSIENKQRIVNTINRYCKTNKNTDQMLPQDVAAAAVLYYAKNNGFFVDEAEYKKYTSTNKLPSIINGIGIADNNIV